MPKSKIKKPFKPSKSLNKSTYTCPKPQETNTLIALFSEGQYTEAATLAQTMTVRFPMYGFGWKVLGAVFAQMGRSADALAPMQKAAELSPTDAQAHNNLGNTLLNLGRLSEAEASYRRALEIEPDSSVMHYNLGNILPILGRLDEAETCYRRALEIDPNFTEAHSNLGGIFYELERLDEAKARYQRALAIRPDFAEAHYNLGNIFEKLDHLDEAETCYRRALEIKPDYADAHCNLGNILMNLGRLDEAKASYRYALDINPDLANTHSNLLSCLSQNVTVDAKTLFYEHRRFGEQFEPPFRANHPLHTNSRNPERVLRIGFVSGDLRNHAVASFIEPVLVHLSNYPQLSLYAYSNHVTEDAVTLRIREYFTHWHSIVGLSDGALAEKIRADSIDILIDLSGHTGKNRLLAFARKPAPVQASWIGYPGTTGLQAMDYYLADRFFLPNEKLKAQFIEKIVYLPAIAPFMPFKEAPSVNALPALNNGYVTFGSFNHWSKISFPVIALWSQLLRALSESRIVLGAMPQHGCDMLVEWFAKEGIVRERLSFHPRCNTRAYLALHHQVDICLDTFPYNGGTTTNHALWMGIPTLTMAGSTPPGRVGALLLSHVGLEEFIAYDMDDFVTKGLNLTKDIDALARIRMGLRTRFEQSAIGQPALIAEQLEHALRIMWQRWCNDLPPADLDVSDNQINHSIHEDAKFTNTNPPMQSTASAVDQAFKQVLEQPQDLQEGEVGALVGRLKDDLQVEEQLNAQYQHAVTESLPVPPNSKKKSKSKTTKQNKSIKKPTLHKGNNPSPQEINSLVTLFTEGQYTEAATLAQRMTVRFPMYGFGWKVLGAVFAQMGRSADALAPMQKAAELSPTDAQAHNNLGNTLLNLGRLSEAEASYRRALEIEPDSSVMHYNLGNILPILGRLNEAETCYLRALEIDPNFAEAHYNLGNTLQKLGCLDEAEASYRQALAIKPNFAEAHYNLGNTFKKLGRLNEAKASFSKAHQLGFKIACILEALILPPIMGTRREVLESRKEFEWNLDKLITNKVTIDDMKSTVGDTNFYLAYHGLNDRDLQIKVAKYYEQACPSLLYTAPHCIKPKSDTRKKIRIGFLSKFLYSHSVSLCYSKIIEILSLKEQFEVTLISSNPIDEKIYSEFIGKRVRMPSNLELARKQLAALELDILVYLDIGMEPLSYFLAFSRLARVQCVMAGHPVTTGITNMDYFLSTGLMEPPDAVDHYSEKVVLLPRPPLYFSRPMLPSILKTRTELGLPQGRHIYMCPMRLQKLHPDFDEAISRILQLDGNGIVVLFEDIVLPFGKKILMERFKQTIPTEIQERIIFLPWLKDPADFISTIAAADVILDPFHFGIGSTAIMIFATGTPLVTIPGEFMRGWMGTGFCKMLDLTECIAKDTEDYAKKAVEIASDQVLREKISTKILKNNSVLYENMQPIEDLVDFFYSLTDN